MHFRSIDDMSRIIRTNIHRIPRDIDVVVGIPRSGLLPASMIALYKNIMLTDFEGLFEGRPLQAGTTRAKPNLKTDPTSWKKILVVDDSIATGEAMLNAAQRLHAANRWEVVTCAIFSDSTAPDVADIIMDICPRPRFFEWNMMHHHRLSEACVDFDGVLCVDPTEEENDDGENYLRFLREARPLFLPTYPIGAIVSSRLEKYRSEVVDWLKRHDVEYKELHLLDLPTAEERRRLSAHANFKSSVYKSNSSYRIFVESDPRQAASIAQQTGKPVICVQDMTYFAPGLIFRTRQKAENAGSRTLKKVKSKIKKVSGLKR